MNDGIDHLPQQVQTEIRKAILEGRKLDAVKLFHSHAKLSLLECKSIIEREMDRLRNKNLEEFVRADGASGPDEMNQILNCIFAFKKLEAVKIYKDSTGVDLMTAKKFIEELIDKLNEECPEQFSGGKGYQPTGCAGMMLVLVVVVLLAVAFGS